MIISETLSRPDCVRILARHCCQQGWLS